MTLHEARKLAEALNPPMYPAKPRPYAVVKINGVYYVIHLPTGKLEGTELFFDLKNEEFKETA